MKTKTAVIIFSILFSLIVIGSFVSALVPVQDIGKFYVNLNDDLDIRISDYYFDYYNVSQTKTLILLAPDNLSCMIWNGSGGCQYPTYYDLYLYYPNSYDSWLQIQTYDTILETGTIVVYLYNDTGYPYGALTELELEIFIGYTEPPPQIIPKINVSEDATDTEKITAVLGNTLIYGVNTFGGLFPAYDEISTSTRTTYVIMTMILFSIAIVLVSVSLKQRVSALSLFLIGGINILLFLYFTSIKYIHIGVLIFFALIGIGIGVLKSVGKI